MTGGRIFRTRLIVIVAVLLLALIGWSVAGLPGAGAGLLLGLAAGVVRWRRLPARTWAGLLLHRKRPIVLTEPVTVANDRAGGGVRYQDGVAVVAVQLLGKAHTPTLFTGSTSTYTENTVDLAELLPLLHQSLGLTVESLSVVSSGSRRRSTGDYPRVYDTLIGTPPYAGQRETWLIARMNIMDNADALSPRSSAGTAALAAAQRISSALRCLGIRAKVATATDIVEMERRVGRSALEVQNRRWRTVRSDGGWLATYWYQPKHLNDEVLDQAWTLRADGIIQNITLFPDGTSTATVTVRNAQPPTAPPSVILKTLPGEQATAIAASLCGPTPVLRGVRRGRLPSSLLVPIGPSGVLLGKVRGGNRLMLPLGDPGEFSRAHRRRGPAGEANRGAGARRRAPNYRAYQRHCALVQCPDARYRGRRASQADGRNHRQRRRRQPVTRSPAEHHHLRRRPERHLSGLGGCGDQADRSGDRRGECGGQGAYCRSRALPC